jgi:hypothetical protein
VTALLRAGFAFALLNALLSFENRWPGFGVRLGQRLSFELCLGLLALLGWVVWRGGLTRRAATAAAAGMLLLVLVRYADVTAPTVLGRPVNLYWDGRHGAELLRVALQSLPVWQAAAALLAGLGGTVLLVVLARWALLTLAQGLAAPRPRPWLLAAVAALTLSFVAYVPGQRDTRWFFSIPLTPTILHQGQLLARVWLPAREGDGLGPSPAFDGSLRGLTGADGPADVLLLFAESYGASSFERSDAAAALAAPRAEFASAIAASGRGVVSARVRSPTFGGASWLAHGALLAGVDTADPALHDQLLASRRPTLVRHFARHGYRTVGWMPGLKRAWPEGAFYGFDRIADDAGIGYRGLDFGYWRIPDQAAMALLHAQELAPGAPGREPRFVVFPTVSTHAPFFPLAPWVDDWSRLTGPAAYGRADLAAALAVPLSAQQPLPRYLDALRYQYRWLTDYLRHQAPRRLVLVMVGDHQPPALVTGPGASWDVPVHVVSDDAALLQRLVARGFVPGIAPTGRSLGAMHQLTPLLLSAFDGPQPAPAGIGGLGGLSVPGS